MTAKKYRTAMGKVVDIGAIMLQNENVRAVGNMKVNARGDTVDSTNRIIDRKATQIQRQSRKTNVMGAPAPQNSAPESEQQQYVDPADSFADLPEESDLEELDNATVDAVPQGGLAAAIAKAKTVQQTKLPSQAEMAKPKSLRKI